MTVLDPSGFVVGRAVRREPELVVELKPYFPTTIRIHRVAPSSV